MRAVLVVVANILSEQAFQVAFVNCDDVIQELTPATPYPTLCHSILPRTLERGADRIHPQGSNRCGDFQSILGITIKDDEPWSGFKWKCFSQLLDDPRACRMLCDIEVQDAPTIVTDDEEAIERAEGDRRNSEEVHHGNRFPVITEKGKPARGRPRISRCPFHPTRDRSLRDVKTEHEKLAMDAWRSPRRVLANQNFGRNYGDAFAQRVTFQTARFAIGVVSHEDPRYIPSTSHNVVAGSFHMLTFPSSIVHYAGQQISVKP
jgi:hypothetical protein